jgi:hypothetical protein
MEKLFDKCLKEFKLLSKNEEKLENKKNEYYALTENVNTEKYNTAIELAFKYITDGAEKKIQERSKYGFNNANLVKFKKNDNLKFNDIILFSLLYQDKKNNKESVLLNQLNTHFMPFKLYKKVFMRSNSCVLDVSWEQDSS